jgi:hypothetical protein
VEKEWQVNGYIKELQITSFTQHFKSINIGNLIHNRINVKGKLFKNLNSALEVRNRVFIDDAISSTSGYGRTLRNYNEWASLSVLWHKRNDVVAHSNIERLWMEYRQKKWNIRAGRQRINWGMTSTWNPNDIFNTYNFLDFDYEERPGSDAVKFQYLFSEISNLEVAVSSSGANQKPVAVARYLFNNAGYDIQFISGLYQDKYTLGFGWAGNILDIGYKGEAQAFMNVNDEGSCFNYSVELDYAFKNNWYTNVSVFHNGNGTAKPLNLTSKPFTGISPLKLMPTKWNIMVTGTKKFNPLFRGNLSLVYAPGTQLFFVLPSFKYRVTSNLDADLFLQSFFAKMDNRFSDYSHHIYLRLKYCF